MRGSYPPHCCALVDASEQVNSPLCANMALDILIYSHLIAARGGERQREEEEEGEGLADNTREAGVKPCLSCRGANALVLADPPPDQIRLQPSANTGLSPIKQSLVHHKTSCQLRCARRSVHQTPTVSSFIVQRIYEGHSSLDVTRINANTVRS